jgi:hypothetical protein
MCQGGRPLGLGTVRMTTREGQPRDTRMSPPPTYFGALETTLQVTIK